MAISQRIYAAKDVAGFMKTRERFGLLSNMAGGMPLVVGGIDVGSSEALYQAMRFPHLPDFQSEIIRQSNAMLAKRHAYTCIGETRQDWKTVNIDVMRYCLRAKYASNKEKMDAVFRETGDLPIVEISSRDDFWGAKPEGGMLRGCNALGRLCMELRQEVSMDPAGSGYTIEPGFPKAILLGVTLSRETIHEEISEQPSFDI